MLVPNPSLPLELGFVALCLLVAVAVALLVRRAGGSAARVGLGLAVYLGIFYGAAASGLFADAVPPKPLLLLVPAFVCALWFARSSPVGHDLAARAPLALLVGLQAFRFPLELLMHAWADEGALPIQMSFAGLNFDIVTGITALLVAPFATRSRALVIAWNILGLLLLINIVTIAILSLPGPLRMFPAGPPNLLVMRPPYVWLPTFLVQVALAGHILVFRALRRR